VAATRRVAVHSELAVLVLKETVEGIFIVSKNAADAKIFEDFPRVDLLVWKIVVRNSRG
jgi:hypothetical protein